MRSNLFQCASLQFDLRQFELAPGIDVLVGIARVWLHNQGCLFVFIGADKPHAAGFTAQLPAFRHFARNDAVATGVLCSAFRAAGQHNNADGEQ